MLKRKTLRFQIYLTIVTAFLLIAIIFSVILYPFENRRRETVIRKIEFLINSVVTLKGESIANELFLKHREAVEIIIKKMLEIEGIAAIGIYDEKGVLFAATDKNFTSEITQKERQAVSQAYAFIEGIWNEQKVVTYTGPIIVIGETLGFLKIHYSLADVVKETHTAIIIFTGLFLTILLSTALILNILLTRFVIRPTDILITAMRKLHSGNLGEQVDIDLDNEIGEMSETFNQMSYENARMYNELNELNENLEYMVEKRTEELKKALSEACIARKAAEQANKKITDSLNYAKLIQRSLLANLDVVKTYIPNSFFIWEPRDIVGGDIFFTEKLEDGFIVAVADCTGHGVPGAFMTMIASSGLRKIIRDEGCHNPSEILKRLNHFVKKTLHQDTAYALSDDGLDAGICFIETEGRPERRLVFAGAKQSLFYVHNGEVTVVKSDKQSIGYKRSDLNFNFTDHRVHIEKGMHFYMATDGFADQLDVNDRRLGTRRFRNLLKAISHLPFEKQRELLIEAYEAHKSSRQRQDDVTVAGFGF